MRRPFQFEDARLFEHGGEELIFVLSGSVEVELSGKLVRLDSGATFYFDAHLPHCTPSIGNKSASTLVVFSGMKHN
jgi:mannose-6-phosphate isomerase-like protein (cupin superfamily)